MGLQVYEFLIDENNDTLGMSAISLVDKPAMKSEFLAFTKTPIKQKFIEVAGAKRMVAGLALIPDKLVYRMSAEGEEYMGFFSAATIEAIRNKFMKDKNIDNVNLQHNDASKIDAYLVESYILSTEDRVNEVKAMGIEDAVLGAWFVAYKFGNSPEAEAAYQDTLKGKYNGFSVEVMLERELKLNKSNNKNNNFMAKYNKFVDKFKALLHEFEVKFEDVMIADGSGMIRYGEVGTPVLMVTTDDAGVESTAPVTAGEYIIEGGQTLVVDDMGNLLEIKEASVEPIAPVVPEGLSEEEIQAKKKAEDEAALAVSGDTAHVVPATGGDITAKTLGEMVDVTKDGKYYITVEVSGGQIVEASVEAEISLVSKADFAAQETIAVELNKTIEGLNAKIVELQAQLDKPVAKSIHEFTEVKVPTKTKEELAKMNNLELVKHRLGL
jgi:hypothetical protein